MTDSIQYRVKHSTKYTYSDAVPLCQNQVRLAPRGLAFQEITRFQLLVTPEPDEIDRRSDWFGNRVDSFSILEPHKVLSITGSSEIRLIPSRIGDARDTPPWEEIAKQVRSRRSAAYLDAYQYTFASPYVPLKPKFAEYAAKSFASGSDIASATMDLTRRIHQDFEYDPTATSLSTPVEEVFASRRGVCQDFAHLQIACLRSLGLPAKYISGYLRTIPPEGQSRLVGADASHAWLAVFCGELGWTYFDPTNNVIPSADHITLAWGRDYGDVCPVRGVFVGGGQHSLAITVDVEPVGAGNDEKPV